MRHREKIERRDNRREIRGKVVSPIDLGRTVSLRHDEVIILESKFGLCVKAAKFVELERLMENLVT